MCAAIGRIYAVDTVRPDSPTESPVAVGSADVSFCFYDDISDCFILSSLKMIDWLSDRLIDWLVVGWLIDWLTDWLIDLLIDLLIDSLIDWLTDWLITLLIDLLIDWFVHALQKLSKILPVLSRPITTNNKMNGKTTAK